MIVTTPGIVDVDVFPPFGVVVVSGAGVGLCCGVGVGVDWLFGGLLGC